MYSRSHCFVNIPSKAAPTLSTRLKNHNVLMMTASLDGEEDVEVDGDEAAAEECEFLRRFNDRLREMYNSLLDTSAAHEAGITTEILRILCVTRMVTISNSGSIIGMYLLPVCSFC